MIELPGRPEMAALRDKMIRHARLDQSLLELDAAISDSEEGEFTLFVGPTGIGKTTTLNKEHNNLVERYGPLAALGQVPILSVRTPGMGASGFITKDFYHAIQRRLDEPGIGSKIEYPPVGRDVPLAVRTRYEPESAARWGCIGALQERGVKIILADEAQHLSLTGGAKHVMSLLESIKYLAEESGVRIVLAGTYGLKGLVDLNAQLSRRTWRVHFDRYHLDNDSDRAAFTDVVRAFQANLPDSAVSLEAHSEQLYDMSLGCVGLLKKLLMRALGSALRTDGRITLEQLRKSSDHAARAIMLREITQGEGIFSPDAIAVAPELPPAFRPVGSTATKRQPFKRNPERDPVGPRGSVGR